MKTTDAAPQERPREKAVAPPMPPSEEETVKVRTLIGPRAGTVVDMPYSAAQNAVMSGTAERVAGEFYKADFPGADPAAAEAPAAAEPADSGDKPKRGRSRTAAATPPATTATRKK